MKNLCTICARKGSKGVPNKNIKKIAGKPLIQHTIEQAKDSGIFKDIIVSSDSERIIKIAKSLGVHFLNRSKKLSADNVGKVEVIQNATLYAEKILKMEFDNVIDLDVTSPLRKISDIKKAYHKFKEKGFDNLVTGCLSRKNPYFNMLEEVNDGIQISKKPNRKVLSRQKSPKVFDMNASIYIWKKQALMKKIDIVHSGTGFYEMPEERSIDIDTKLDWEIVSYLMER